MMYQHMVLDDETAIAHSKMKNDEKVKVDIERQVEGEFNYAIYWISDL